MISFIWQMTFRWWFHNCKTFKHWSKCPLQLNTNTKQDKNQSCRNMVRTWIHFSATVIHGKVDHFITKPFQNHTPVVSFKCQQDIRVLLEDLRCSFFKLSFLKNTWMELISNWSVSTTKISSLIGWHTEAPSKLWKVVGSLEFLMFCTSFGNANRLHQEHAQGQRDRPNTWFQVGTTCLMMKLSRSKFCPKKIGWI